ncbi:MAG: pyridoxal phosphate-dependent aminotransferase [Oscillospiraceae bacterium]
MNKGFSSLLMTYPTSGIRKMFDMAADYPGFINLCNGEPDFTTPAHICEAAKEGLDMGLTKYAPEPGLPILREALAQKCTAQFGYTVTPDQIVVSGGGVEAIMLSLMSIINPGDEVIIPDPAYTCYVGQAQLLGAKVVRLPLLEENGFCPTAQQLEELITPQTKALILNYPNNPTGAVLTQQAAQEIVPVLQKHGIWVISDEVYENIVFDGYTHISLAHFDDIQDQVIVTNSFSKTYAMTGWRLGYLFSRNQSLMQRIPKMHQPLTACLPGFIQYAGAKAVQGPQTCVEEMVQHYTNRRALMQKELAGIKGLRPVKNDGTFCFYISIAESGMSSDEVSARLLKEAGVLTTPGTAFGENGSQYLRLSFANAEDKIAEGMSRIRRFFAGL